MILNKGLRPLRLVPILVLRRPEICRYRSLSVIVVHPAAHDIRRYSGGQGRAILETGLGRSKIWGRRTVDSVRF